MSMKREITAGTLATILGTILLPVVYWFWSSISSFIGAIWRWLGSPVSLPMWLALLMGTVCLIVIGILCVSAIQNSLGAACEHRKFTEMEFKGFVWRWEWGAYGHYGLDSYCPNCDRLARYSESGRLRSPEVEVFCSNCRHLSTRQPGTFRDLKNDVTLEIEHAVRTGRWKRMVKEPEAQSA